MPTLKRCIRESEQAVTIRYVVHRNVWLLFWRNRLTRFLAVLLLSCCLAIAHNTYAHNAVSAAYESGAAADVHEVPAVCGN